MNKDRARKLKRMLTTREPPRDPPEPAVVICPPGTLPHEHVEALVADGRKSAVLCVPAVPQTDAEVEAWARSTAAYQGWLLNWTMDNPPTGDEITEAYRRSLSGEAMPN